MNSVGDLIAILVINVSIVSYGIVSDVYIVSIVSDVSIASDVSIVSRVIL